MTTPVVDQFSGERSKAKAEPIISGSVSGGQVSPGCSVESGIKPVL